MKIIALLVLLSSFHLSAQPTGVETENHSNSAEKSTRTGTTLKNTVSGTVGYFDPWVGVSYERLFAARWGVDASVGLIGGSVGTKIYFPKVAEGKVSFLVGISEGVLLLVGTKHYIPAGMTYLGKQGFRFSVDVGPQIYHDTRDGVDFGMSLRLGKTF